MTQLVKLILNPNENIHNSYLAQNVALVKNRPWDGEREKIVPDKVEGEYLLVSLNIIPEPNNNQHHPTISFVVQELVLLLLLLCLTRPFSSISDWKGNESRLSSSSFRCYCPKKDTTTVVWPLGRCRKYLYCLEYFVPRSEETVQIERQIKLAF